MNIVQSSRNRASCFFCTHIRMHISVVHSNGDCVYARHHHESNEGILCHSEILETSYGTNMLSIRTWSRAMTRCVVCEDECAFKGKTERV